MFKKIIIVIFIFCISLCVFFSGKNYLSNASEKFSYTVDLDAGHGGIDVGVTGVKTKEKERELNLLTVLELKKVFENAGYKVVLTRENDGGLYGDTSSGFKLRDLNKRRQIINGANADVLISIHMNKYQDSRRRGAQVFYKENDKTSNFLAEKIQNRLNLMKESTRISKSLKGDYYLLNTSNIPAVIVECGFLSNASDEKLLTDSAYRSKIANVIFLGVSDYLAIKYS
ncbi:MAG: N-acetylmuramoyl-L-alanine amidase [Clostridia bacterium]|nr:N-acetylmuramoyl-L-alanine amidase [Clostridia bacterium]